MSLTSMVSDDQVINGSVTPEAVSISSDDDDDRSANRDGSERSETPHLMADAASYSNKESNGDGEVLDAEALTASLKEQGNKAFLEGHAMLATKFYSDALEQSPKSAVLLSNRSLAYIKLENYGLAIVDATAAVECDPNYAKGYYRRGTAKFALNKAKEARRDFKRVCTLLPKDKDARARLEACEKFVKEALFKAAIQSDETVPLSELVDPDAIVVDEGYDGPRPNGDASVSAQEEDALFEPGRLPMDFVMAAVKRFKDQKLIHKRYVTRLLVHCKRYFSSLSSLTEISIPEHSPSHSPKSSPRITVCGDTHGQFYDVLNIFDINGYPSATNPYLFNGDFVDRGSFSVEVILTYLLFKMACPQCIHLTRGNHETKCMTRLYGFEGEVKAKYDDKILELCLEVFCHLPLAAVIGEKIFVTHGGIPVDPVALDDIRNIKRGCEPPDSGLMSDLLWSDPQPFPGKSPSKRGVGYSFGPDITKAFLSKNDLSLLVRSHEVKDDGYLVEHGGKTITVFSAPNYCDSVGNQGAFIHLDATLEPKFTQFSAVSHPYVRPMAYAAGMAGLFA